MPFRPTPSKMETYFSYSRISTFRKCPKAYEFAYIKETPEAFQTIEKHLGTAVHETFEWIYRERGKGETPPLPTATEQYGRCWESLNIKEAHIIKTDISAGDYFLQGLNLVKAHYQRSIARDQSITLHLEHEFEIPLDAETPYRGIIDRISRLPSGKIRLIDYKTGRLAVDPFTELQLPSYTLYIFQEFRSDTVEICIEDLRSGRTLVKEVERGESETIRSELLGQIGAVRSARTYPAAPSALCSWCGYIDQCPEGNSRKNGTKSPTAANIPRECPYCGAPLREKKGRFGAFLGCSDFPACRYTRNL